MAITMAKVARDHPTDDLTNDPITGIGERQFKATDAIVSAIDVDVIGVRPLLATITEAGVVNQPNSIHIPSIEMEITAMSENVYKLRDRAGESEKITVNLGYVDLGRIDLLVQEGFYSNRTDFIRTAIRNQLTAEGEAVKQSIIRHTLELGLRDYSRADLEAVRVAGERLHIKVLGLARIASDVTPELALATIDSITVLGALQASRELKSALAERIR
jgi:Arc/MetJ-type ribon-helix-helix transcriptional regulator